MTGRIIDTPRARHQLRSLDEWVVAAASKDRTTICKGRRRPTPIIVFAEFSSTMPATTVDTR